MRVYAYPESALWWADSTPETVGWLSRVRACFPIGEDRAVPLIEKSGSTSIFWALLERWMPEKHALAMEEMEAARDAGDGFGETMVRDLVQTAVCLKTAEELAGRKMIALMREPVARFWSGWAHQCHASALGKTAALRRRVPMGSGPEEAVRWLMETDPGRVDEHFAPQWTTLAPGAEVHAMTEAGVADFCEAVELEDLPRRNVRAGKGPEPGGEAAGEVLRWLLGQDCRIYAEAAAS